MDCQGNEDRDSTFWKKSNKPVPGRPSPLKEARGSQHNSSSTSFQVFQESTSDAWDIGDDKFFNNLDANVAYSTALEVINTHRIQSFWKQEISKVSTSDCVHKLDTGSNPVAGEFKRNLSKVKGVSGENEATASKLKSVSSRSETTLCKLESVQCKSGTTVSEQESVTSESETTVNKLESVCDESKLKVSQLKIIFNENETTMSGLKSASSESKAWANKLKSVSDKSEPTLSHMKSNSGVSETNFKHMSKLAKFQTLLQKSLLDITELRNQSWSGIPVEVRPITWRLLAGYLPASSERRKDVTKGKRLDYWNSVKQYFDTERDNSYRDTYRQIHIDIPRMSPLIPLFQQKIVQEMFERILFVWAIRHPASGYVQGINDLLTPFYVVFLQEYFPPGSELDTFEVSSLPKQYRDIVEADSFWCLSNFLDRIQDNYIFAQVGIQQKVGQLKEIIQRVDGKLHEHLEKHDVDYLQFSFRWMNNLLTRELPLRCLIRLWDTYLAEADGFASFLIYACAAFLLRWRRELLLERDFQGLMKTLQNLPTKKWADSDIGVLVAEAFKLKFSFADAPNHLQSGDNR